MIPIKNNLEDFIEKIEQLGDAICSCNDEEKLYVYLKTYNTFCYLYELNSVDSVFIEEIDSNDFYKDVLDRGCKKDFHKTDTMFLNDKGKLEKICLRDSFYLEDILEDFSKTKFYKDKEKLYNKRFKSNELYDILINFFKEENKEMLDIFEELRESKRFYRLTSSEDLLSNALSIFNPLDKKSSILVRRNLVNIRFLEAYVHEVAHVLDYNSVLKNSNEFETALYASNSLLSEVTSTVYSLKIYDYMLENGILVDDAVIGLANTLLAYTISLDTASLICALSDEDYLKLSLFSPREKDIIDLLKKNNPEFLVNEDLPKDILMEHVDITETMQYAYGCLLSKCLFQKNNLDKFLQLKDKYPSVLDLKEAGFDIGKDAHVLTKHLEKYL